MSLGIHVHVLGLGPDRLRMEPLEPGLVAGHLPSRILVEGSRRFRGERASPLLSTPQQVDRILVDLSERAWRLVDARLQRAKIFNVAGPAVRRPGPLEGCGQ